MDGVVGGMGAEPHPDRAADSGRAAGRSQVSREVRGSAGARENCAERRRARGAGEQHAMCHADPALSRVLASWNSQHRQITMDGGRDEATPALGRGRLGKRGTARPKSATPGDSLDRCFNRMGRHPQGAGEVTAHRVHPQPLTCASRPRRATAQAEGCQTRDIKDSLQDGLDLQGAVTQLIPDVRMIA